MPSDDGALRSTTSYNCFLNDSATPHRSQSWTRDVGRVRTTRAPRLAVSRRARRRGLVARSARAERAARALNRTRRRGCDPRFRVDHPGGRSHSTASARDVSSADAPSLRAMTRADSTRVRFSARASARAAERRVVRTRYVSHTTGNNHALITTTMMVSKRASERTTTFVSSEQSK